MMNDLDFTNGHLYFIDVRDQLPERYIINKGATILFWKDGTKTVVKLAKGDEHNKVLGFLWAYFQKRSGLSKTKANEYIRNLISEEELKLTHIDGAFKVGDRVTVRTLSRSKGTIKHIINDKCFIEFDYLYGSCYYSKSQLTKL